MEQFVLTAWPILLMGAIFYFFMYRPQLKRKAAIQEQRERYLQYQEECGNALSNVIPTILAAGIGGFVSNYVINGLINNGLIRKYEADDIRDLSFEELHNQIMNQNLASEADILRLTSEALLTNNIIQEIQDQTDLQNRIDMQTLIDMDFHAAQQFAIDNQLIDQSSLDAMLNDPYINPGLDIVVDESFHGIDHGLGIADHHHFDDHSHYSFEDHSHLDNMNNGSGFDNH